MTKRNQQSDMFGQFDGQRLVSPQANRPVMDATKSAGNRDAAMDSVDSNANEAWKTAALQAVKRCAMHRIKFTVDDVWEFFPDGAPGVHDRRAMGPVMRRAASENWIEATGEYRPSTQVTGNAGPRRVWKSLI